MATWKETIAVGSIVSLGPAALVVGQSETSGTATPFFANGWSRFGAVWIGLTIVVTVALTAYDRLRDRSAEDQAANLDAQVDLAGRVRTSIPNLDLGGRFPRMPFSVEVTNTGDVGDFTASVQWAGADGTPAAAHGTPAVWVGSPGVARRIQTDETAELYVMAVSGRYDRQAFRIFWLVGHPLQGVEERDSRSHPRINYVKVTVWREGTTRPSFGYFRFAEADPIVNAPRLERWTPTTV